MHAEDNRDKPTPDITKERVLADLSTGIGMVDVPDEIVGTPGGSAYRANVHEQGVPDRWPEVEMAQTRITSNSGAINVRYRKDIATKAGEIRNNLLYITKETGHFDFQSEYDVKLYTISAPPNLHFSQGVGGGLPGSLEKILIIEVPPEIATGIYHFSIVISIGDASYDPLPCTIEVSSEGEPDAIVRELFGVTYAADFFAQNGSTLPG